jgi:hypothetical protein
MVDISKMATRDQGAPSNILLLTHRLALVPLCICDFNQSTVPTKSQEENELISAETKSRSRAGLVLRR